MVMCNRSPLPLSQIEVLVVDCQATAPAPRGHLLEIGWARVCTTITHAHACLIALPGRARIPPAVARTSFAEAHEAKGFVVLQLTRSAIGQFEFRQLPARPGLLTTGRFGSMTAQIPSKANH